MSEEIGADFGPQSPHELAGPATECAFSALGAFSQEVLEDTVGSLDRIEVRRIRRQVTQNRADGFDGFLHTLNLMSRNIVHDDNVAALEGRRQALLDISEKDLAIGAPLIIIGAVMRSQRSAATTVTVFQAANGTCPITRSPRGRQPK